jgi:SAM-dependent methyltransferase
VADGQYQGMTDDASEHQPDHRFAGFAPVGATATVRANRSWWDAEAAAYRSEHASDLAGRLIWGPEGLDEADAALLGPVQGLDILEVGAGAGDGAAWLRGQGARAVASDLSIGMLREAGQASSSAITTSGTGPLPRLQADARALPLADGSFDLVFTAYGVLPFVADPDVVHAEVARVLRPGGRWVFALSHPIRWAFPDDPGAGGLTVSRSYFDRTPYLETGPDGQAAYAEHHRTLGDQVGMLVAAGFILTRLTEPEWPDTMSRTWGGWSPTRGRLIPGTAIFSCRKPG